MAAPFEVCTKEEERAVFRFLWSESVKGSEIHRRLSSQYGGSALSRKTVFLWIEKFKSGRTRETYSLRVKATWFAFVSSSLEPESRMFETQFDRKSIVYADLVPVKSIRLSCPYVDVVWKLEESGAG
ncbi:hypothetical protein AVEN_178433-1 [Araneus ventricosus]|uniref:Mos1 transposase HTH domain-containing protein n=1 Tax=Araneus ventricosus TaxID=182803 RepID=A0A4Y2W8M1_ARAVE|nr:hypothetical protein AVEN_178433-1 [Araneus ventricosus]